MSDICELQRLKVMKEYFDKKGMFVHSQDLEDVAQKIQTLTASLAAKEKELESINMLGDIIDQREAKIRELKEALAAKEKECEELRDKRNPHLRNRADGVNGHYCIGRQHESGKYYEFWNSEKRIWCSAGTVIDLTTQQNR